MPVRVTPPFDLRKFHAPDVIVGITGTRDEVATDDALNIIEGAVFAFDPQRALFVWGGCVGVDVTVASFAEMYEQPRHCVLPPNRSLVAHDWPAYVTTYEEIPHGPDGYKRRNQRIVDLSDRLLAFPLYPEDHPQSRRSGTWQTIRMARRKGIPVDVYVLSEVV